ncbi:MAG: hypothetical protein JRH11_17965 [Deltaproteobacteria bacterium]|nr:hypothetical protein [Deltaproteobacteria bacterium]
MAWRQLPGALALGLVLVLGGCSAIVSPDDGLLGGEGSDGGFDTSLPGSDSSTPPADSGAGRDSSVTPADSGVVSDTGTPVSCDFDLRCAGNRLETCVDGAVSSDRCALGCDATGAVPACAQMIPSNVEATFWRGDAPDVVIESALGFDTSDCAAMSAPTTIVAQVGALELCVLSTGDFEIREGGSLLVTGSRPLVIMAAGDVHIIGDLNVSAEGQEAGPGGFGGGTVSRDSTLWDGRGPFGGEAGEHTNSFDDGGGGGGGLCGHGGAGGAGGDAGGGASGGQVDAGWELVPLFGGSGGGRGRGYVSSTGGGTNVGMGGAGGGALQISTEGTIEISGVIAAGGGGGLPGRNAFGATFNWGSGGGGGSGGAVLLEAPEIRFDGGRVVAGGGGGGGGGGRDSDGEAGDNGGAGTALGGAGDTVRGAPGGNGSGPTVLSGLDGGDNPGSNANGGGGGGAAGCLLFRTADATVDGATMTNPSAMPGVRFMPVRR